MKKIGTFSDKMDLFLTILVGLACLIGLVAVNSAAASLDGHLRLVLVQAAAVVLGVVLMAAIILVDYHLFDKLRFVVFAIGLALLVTVLVIGKITHGTQGWITLGPVNIQPGEITKICFIITLSAHLSRVRDTLNQPKTLLLLLLHLAIYAGLVLLQPDTGTAMVFMFIFVVMLFFSGLYKRYIFGALGVVAVAAPVIWFAVLQPYQRDRFLSFLHPENDPTGTGYHVIQSKIAAGSGQIFGRGYMRGVQTQNGFLPEKQTDFIFSSIAEEWGLIGALVVVAVLFLIIYRCFDNARDAGHDPFGEMLCCGVGAMLLFHTLENIGMCLGLLPITGIPLPFISYGGSSMLTCMAAIGLVQSVRMRRRAVKFNL